MRTTPNYFKKLYQWILPPTCILCGYPAGRSQDLCQHCLAELPILPQSCPRCANTLVMATSASDFACGQCLKQPPSFDATYALYTYQSPITKLIMELKFNQQLVNARILGECIANKIKNTWYDNKPLPDMIIPVPLHAKRLQKRGFNQALEIARPISNLLKLPINSTLCLRIKHTSAQAMLPAEKRSQNMKNAFFIKQSLAGYHIAVIDDVITTGHTITELSDTLKKAGARKIDIWCVAKTLRDGHLYDG